jgi:hypothetical protein
MPAPSLIIQTTYAELLERCAAGAFADAFPDAGSFTSKTAGGRRYWYFQSTTASGRSQKYVGPDSKEVLERIAQHRRERNDERERRTLVSTLVRAFGMPRPVSDIGEVITTLERAGVFRLRGVLVGTVAYQCYSAMLGSKLPGALLQTNDVDVAQFADVSIAVADRTDPMLKVLASLDSTFREVPPLDRRQKSSSYVAATGLKVDFLTPNRGPESDTPHGLPALQTGAEPLRFLDFLIYESTPAVLLYKEGVYVNVPSPERFAIHKLIIARRRPVGSAKSDKDLHQAAALIEVLSKHRAAELRDAWEEAFDRGPTWRKLLLEGLSLLEMETRDLTLRVVHRSRDVVPGVDLLFRNPPLRYDGDREIATFDGESQGAAIRCAISREALEDHFGANDLDRKGRLDAVRRNRSQIEALVRAKYLTMPVEQIGSVLLTTPDVEKLSRPDGKAKPR